MNYTLVLFLAFATNSATQISVNVDLVVLNATVEQRNGAPAPGLHKEDFTIFEDGVKQSLRLFSQEDIPVTAGIIVDHSGSMRAKLENVVTAARTFVRQSSPEDEMFVVNFNDSVRLGLPPSTPFSNKPELLAAAIANTAAEGRTTLYDAIAEGLRLAAQGHRQKRVLIVVSDGGDNASKATLDQTLQLAIRSSAVIYTIGIFDESDPDRNPAVLRKLAHATGGEAYFPQQLSEVTAIAERIARDIRHQYTLGYVSTNDIPSPKIRRIRVTAVAPGAPKLIVRTRAGYIAGGSQ